MGGYSPGTTGAHPVTRVNWYDVVKWCNARSEMEGRRPVYYLNDVHSLVYRGGEIDLANTWIDLTANGFRLPTEAEWEYACRAGTTTSFSSGPITATGGDLCANLDLVGWYAANSGGNTHPSGGKVPNAWGLFDLHGNVWEWVWDRHEAFDAGAKVDPLGPATGTERILRGGSHNNNAENCQASSRFPHAPGNEGAYGGFRIAVSLPAE